MHDIYLRWQADSKLCRLYSHTGNSKRPTETDAHLTAIVCNHVILLRYQHALIHFGQLNKS